MYEIWLVINILWEIALGIWQPLLAAAIAWALLALRAARSPDAPWRSGLVPAMGIGLLVAVAAAALIPGWSRSSVSDMGYWVDWANLLAIAAGFGAAAMAFAWPLLAMRKSAAHRVGESTPRPRG